MGNAGYKDWRRQRSVANPVFHRAMPVETFGQIALRMFQSMDKLNPDGKIDAADYTRRYITRTMKSILILNFFVFCQI